MQETTEEFVSSAAFGESSGMDPHREDTISDPTEKLSAASADDSSSDDDDKPIVRSKKSLRNTVLDDSDEESDSHGDDVVGPLNETATDSGHLKKLALDDNQTGISEVTLTKKSHQLVFEDSDEEVDMPDIDADLPGGATSNTASGKDAEISAMQTAEWTRPEATSAPVAKEQDLFANSDLFDAELDGNKENESASDSDEGQREDEHSDDDSCTPETTKEAHKKPVRASRPPRMKKTDIQQIHSESQRLVRESRLRIPYHQPQKLDISVFLQRTQAKQAQLQKMNHRGPSWKVAPVLHQPVKTTKEKRSISRKEVPPIAVVDLNIETKATFDEDSLPDLAVDIQGKNQEIDTGRPQVESKPKYGNRHPEIDSQENEETDAVDLTEFASEVLSEIMATKNTTSKPDQDSGYITTPVNSEEENSADDNKNLDDPENECRASEKRTLLTPKLRHMGVASLTPQLSGGPGVIIDLNDEEDEGVGRKEENSGVSQLMERLMKHSHSVPRESREVEISTMVRKPGEDTGEELQLEKFTYHVEGEEVIDPKLNVPGAKLCLLRERLRAQMKVRREEARKKRYEMYELDNEEGFDGEEEAELTDQTDTDDEEIEEEEEDEEALEEDTGRDKEPNPFLDAEAEDDEDNEDDDLQLKLDSVNYDDEVSSESKESTHKDFLKTAMEKTHSLALFDDNTGSSVRKIPLEKTRTFELFDEDANTESPTMSQKSNTEKHEISERPFEQLSGNSVMAVMELGSPRDPMQDDISEGKDETTMSLFKDRDTSFNSTDTSFEMTGSLIPGGQRPRRRYLHSGSCNTPDMFTGSSKSSTTTPGVMSKSASRLSDMELPIEDTQDLLMNNSPALRFRTESTPRLQSQSFHFSLNYESQSQMLDDDGMLKITSVDRKAARRQLLLDMGDSGASGSMTQELIGLCSGQFAQETGSGKGFSHGTSMLVEDSQSNADELLGLCSGRFTERPSSSEQGMLGDVATQDDMGELLGLCSGKFSGEQEEGEEGDKEDSPVKKTKGQKRKKMTFEEEDNTVDSFSAVSDASVTENMPEENLDSDVEEQEEEEGEGSEEEERGNKGLGKKHGLVLGDFVDEEAELSGSEFDSDENLELSESEDILEREAGDDDDLGTEEHLRNQVGRVHLKTMIDSDKRELMLLQEMYLPDGDLHSDGGGRFRRFRWKNVDEDTQQDMFDNSDEDNGGNEEEDGEDRWRAERHAREKFLEEQAANEDKDEDSNNTLVRLGKVTFKQKKGCSQHSSRQSSEKKGKHVGAEKSLFKMPAMHGSLLRMNKGALAKIAEMAKPAPNVTAPKNLRKFIFTALSPEKKTSEEEVKKRPQVRRTVSVDSAKPVAKKPRLEKSNSTVQRRNSIFDLF